MHVKKLAGLGLVIAAMFMAFGVEISVAADATYGQAVEGQTGLQLAATEIMEEITKFYNGIMVLVVIPIALFVLALLIYVSWRFSAKRNPTPSKNSHNTLVEVIWTVVPIMILVAIFIPSLKLLRLQEIIPEADLTIKAIGQQWYWDYEYPDHGDFAFTATMIEEEDLVAGQPRLLATDEPVLVPVNKTVRLLVAAGDVIHAWAIPSFGIKTDAVPGRINEIWFTPTREGVYYGQCSELCGSRHAFMPIEVHVVSEAKFETWISRMQNEYGSLETDTDIHLAQVNTK